MRKSGRIQLKQLRQAYRLIHDCRDVGHDHQAWPVILIEGLARLVNAQIVMMAEIGLGGPGTPPSLNLVADRGWPSSTLRESFTQRHLIDQEFRELPTFQQFAALRGKLVTRTREQLVSDGDWYRSQEFNEYNRAWLSDDMLISHAMIGDPPILQGFNVHGELGRVRFSPSERRLVRLLHLELASQLGHSLAREPDHPLPNLPPRLLATLKCLLEGDSEKQVALRLNLSRHTIHQYVKDLYQRLGVGTRAELLAYCLRRNNRDTRIEKLP